MNTILSQVRELEERVDANTDPRLAHEVGELLMNALSIEFVGREEIVLSQIHAIRRELDASILQNVC